MLVDVVSSYFDDSPWTTLVAYAVEKCFTATIYAPSDPWAAGVRIGPMPIPAHNEVVLPYVYRLGEDISANWHINTTAELTEDGCFLSVVFLYVRR